MLTESIEPKLPFVPVARALIRMAAGVPEYFWSVFRGAGWLSEASTPAGLVPC